MSGERIRYNASMKAIESAITAKQLRVMKDRKTILHDLTFSIQRGTLTGLVGPSGSGKTTLMRTIVGVQKPAGGEVKVLGIEAGDKRLRSKIGYVTQSPSVYGDLTVEQNLSYFATIMRAAKDDVQRVIKDVDLDLQKDQIVDSLSGGERARVSLAVALLGDPELLVLDEPTVGLDPVLRESLWMLFAKLADGGKTLLISSHVMDEAERCENLVLLRDGDILWSASKVALLSHTREKGVEAAFIAMVKEDK